MSSFLKKDEWYISSSSGCVLLHIMPSRSQSSTTYLLCRSCVEKRSEGGRLTLRAIIIIIIISQKPQTCRQSLQMFNSRKSVTIIYVEFRILKHMYSKDVKDIQRLVLLTQWEKKFVGSTWVHYDFPLVVGLTKTIIFVNLGLFRHFETVTNIRTWIKSHRYWRML